jgi:hypothetical protein
VGTYAKEIGGKILEKEILHFGKSGLGFLDILSLFFSQEEEATRVRGRGETGCTCG